MIDGYVFGKISINGQTFDRDVEVRWDGEVFGWERNRGHIFGVKDIKRALGTAPEIIIFGIGSDGLAEVNDEIRDELNKRGIEFVVCKTREAVKDFNICVYSKKRVVGLFHLTC